MSHLSPSRGDFEQFEPNKTGDETSLHRCGSHRRSATTFEGMFEPSSVKRASASPPDHTDFDSTKRRFEDLFYNHTRLWSAMDRFLSPGKSPRHGLLSVSCPVKKERKKFK